MQFGRLSLGMMLAFVVLLSFISCGKKTNPKPPDETAPAAVKSFTAVPSKDGLTLKWVSPEVDESGNELGDLARFSIKRSDYVKDEEPDFEEVGRTELRPVAPGTVDTSDPYTFLDKSLKRTQKYEYIVVPVNEEGIEGASSRRLRVTFLGETSVIESF